jgi:hypothetical protein
MCCVHDQDVEGVAQATCVELSDHVRLLVRQWSIYLCIPGASMIPACCSNLVKHYYAIPPSSSSAGSVRPIFGISMRDAIIRVKKRKIGHVA